MQQETFHWPHKYLLDVDQLTQEELFHLLDTAANLHEINSRPVKKVPILKGKKRRPLLRRTEHPHQDLF